MLIIPLYLLLLHSTFVVSRSAFYFSNRSPYLRRSGSSGSNNYYVTPSPASTPTPPSPSPLLSNNIIYSFSPLDEETMKKYGHRNTRDTEWPAESEEDRRLLEKFSNPNFKEEPSCHELKRMWKIARKMQLRDTTRDNRPFFYNTVTSPKLDLQDEDDLNKEESNALLFTSPKKMKTDRRRLSVIPSRSSTESIQNDDDEDENKSRVYGKISQYQPTTKVHDPTNDIYNILRSRKERQINHLRSLRMRANQNEIPNYGNIRYYDAPSKSSPSSFMDKLRSKLRDDKGLPTLSSSSSNDERSSNEFDGFITQEEPSITQSPRPFEKLRLQLLSGDKENDDDRMVAFDSIKNKLLNKSIKQRMIDQSSRGIRRKNSKKRRKNLIQLMKIREAELRREYLRNLYERITDEEEKRRRNRKNRRNGRHKTMRRMQDLRKSNEGVIKYEEE
uniref:Uncharacterized protein n=1 Tax=Lepeophtheirus salmonis TaxID=72036 RepID=A0A0K2UER8_LEPSM